MPNHMHSDVTHINKIDKVLVAALLLIYVILNVPNITLELV